MTTSLVCQREAYDPNRKGSFHVGVYTRFIWLSCNSNEIIIKSSNVTDTKQYQFSSLGWKVNIRSRSNGIFIPFSVVWFALPFSPLGRESIPKLVYRLNDSIVLFDTFHIYSLVFIAVDSVLALDLSIPDYKLVAFIAHCLLFDQTKTPLHIEVESPI